MIREVRPKEYQRLGQLMVEIYAGLEGFPTPEEQPAYYRMLADIGRLTEQQDTQVLVALSPEGDLLGGVVYYGDMGRYGAGGTASQESNASGLRLLGVDPKSRGAGVGRALAEACIERARERGHAQVMLHTTQAMQVAWRLYQKIGFVRSPDMDFDQEGLPVFGFRLRLDGQVGEALCTTSYILRLL